MEVLIFLFFFYKMRKKIKVTMSSEYQFCHIQAPCKDPPRVIILLDCIGVSPIKKLQFSKILTRGGYL